MHKTSTPNLLNFLTLMAVFAFSFLLVEDAKGQQPIDGFPYTDSFKNPTSPGTTFGGQNDVNSVPTLGSAFLTASQTQVTSFGSVGNGGTLANSGSNKLVTADPAGGGYLRLTRTVGNQTAYARNERTFPTTDGLSIRFEYYTYGGSADGIVFFLYDAAVVNRSLAASNAVGYSSAGFNVGTYGGSLGYAQNATLPGLSKGFLGVGFDEFGNFGLEIAGRQGGYGTGGGDRVADRVTLRGDGDGTGSVQPGFGAKSNYEYLIGINTSSATAMASKGGAFEISAGTGAPASRTAGYASTDKGYRKARIVIKYINASNFLINVYVDANTTGIGPAIERHVIQNYTYIPTQAAPANLSYGFSASTGGSTNVHEIRAIDIRVPPDVLKVPVATAATTTTLEDTPVNIDLTTFAYDENGNDQLNFATGLDIDPTVGGIQNTRTIPGQGTFTANASGTVTFTPLANFNGGPVSTDYTIADFGNTSPTVVVSTSAAASLTVTVTPVNDAPTTTSSSITTKEDTPITITTASFPLTDSFDNPSPNTLLSVVLGPPSSGTLTINGTPISSSTTVSAASITANQLIYTPALNSSGSPTIPFQVRDNGGTANGGVDLSSSATLTVNVTAVNDPPTSASKTVSTNAGFAYTFTPSDFVFSDAFDNPQNNFIQVKITTLPASGTLKFNNVLVNAGDFISSASITSLVYTPAAGTGLPYTNFTFQVKDDGGVALGGQDLSIVPSTMTINVVPINTAPVASASSVTTNEDVVYTFASGNFQFSDNFDNPQNTLKSVIFSTLPSAGTITFGGVPITAGASYTVAQINAGSITYTPPTNSNGIPFTTFAFKVQDNGGTNGGGSDISVFTGTMTLNVRPVNDAPTAVATSFDTNEDAVHIFTTADFPFTDIFDNPSPNLLSAVTISTLPASGTILFSGTPIAAGASFTAAQITSAALTYQPPLNASGSPMTTFTFTVYDDGGTANGGINLSAPATITVNVRPANDPPIAQPRTISTNQNVLYPFTTADFPFTDTFDTPPNTLLEVEITTLPSAGTLTLNGVNVTAGQFIPLASVPLLKFAPPVNQSGSPTTVFTFRVRDNGGTSNGGNDLSVAAATITINVVPVNGTPTAVAKTIVTNEDITHVFTTADFPFTDTFNTPANGLSAVQITTLPASGTILFGGTAIAAGASFTVAQINSNALTYVPPAQKSGSPMGSFLFRVQDNGGTANGGTDLSSTATITLNVLPVNDEPSGIDKTINANTGTPYTFAIGDFAFTDALDNPSDALDAVKITTLPVLGTLTLGGVPVTAGQIIPAASLSSLVYTPAGSGPASFTFQVRDTGGGLNGGVNLDGSPNTISFNVSSTNTAPVAVADTYAVLKGGTISVVVPGVLTNDTDADGNTLRAIKVTDPVNGTLTLNTNGSFTYVHNNGPSTSDSFNYKVNDGTVDGNTVTVTITVNATNVPPVAIGDAYSVLKGSTLSVLIPGVLINDSDADGNPLTAIKVTDPINGTLVFNANGSFTYVHNNGPSTSDSFTYKVNDGTVDGNTVTVRIAVNASNAPPVAVNDTYAVSKGNTLTVAVPGVISNDTDPDGNTLSAIKVTNPTNGTLTLNPNGSFTYVHNNGPSTSDSFTYKVNDGVVDGNTATVTINVNGLNNVPLIADVPKIGAKDTPLPFTILDFSTKFVDDDPLVKVKIVTVPGIGTLVINGIPVTPGQEIPVTDLPKLTFIPPAGFTGGPISFQYNSSDGKDYALIPKNVNITINSKPVAVPDTYSTTKGGTLTIPALGVLINDTDADGNSLSAIQMSNPANGIVTLNANGSFVYTHNGGTSTSDSFTYKVNDGISDGNTTTVTININGVNAPPVVFELPKIGTGFTPITFTPEDFKGKYTDPNGDPLVKVQIIGLPPVGILKFNGIPVIIGQEIPVANLGGLTFEPPVNWSGTTTFPWNGSDGSVYANVPANVSLTVALGGDPTAKIGLAKHLASILPALNGTYDVKFVFTAVNYGLNVLENISLRDNLSRAFGGADVTIKGLVGFGNLKVNNSFNGLSVTELLLPTSKLTSGEEARVELTINVKPGINGGTFQNTAIAEGTSAINGIRVTDISTNGLKPDPLVAGNVTPSEATPIQLDAKPAFVPQGFSPNGDGQNDKFVIQNTNGNNVHLEVYNRWGNRVYKSLDYLNDWGGEVTEGLFLGRDIPDGTYYYIIIIDKKDKYSGFITVNR